MKFDCIEEHRGTYPVRMMCRLLGVSESGFYAARGRQVCRRDVENHILTGRIRELHVMSNGTYGSPRIHRDLLDEGFKVGRHRVARLMREERVVGVHRRRFRCLTRRDERDPVAPNVVNQDFTASGPNQKWVADITYIKTGQGFVYLAIILDLFSRRVVGWSLGDTLHTELVLRALTMALFRRRPSTGLVHHSDRGCQCTSADFRKALDAAGIRCSMSSVGNCFDNAAAESFFATLKTECIYRTKPKTRDQARLLVVDFIERFYNRRRKHSAIGQVSPVRYEENHAAQLAA